MSRHGLWLSLFFTLKTAAATTPLPKGFAGIEVGHSWGEVKGLYPFEDLATPTSIWGKFVAQCGYRTMLANLEKGQLMVTVNDHVVTDVSYTTAIEPHADLFEVADLVIESYGQPSAAVMRDLFGQVTIDKDRVNFITLEYDRRDQIVFYISGRDGNIRSVSSWSVTAGMKTRRFDAPEKKMLRPIPVTGPHRQKTRPAHP